MSLHIAAHKYMTNKMYCTEEKIVLTTCHRLEGTLLPFPTHGLLTKQNGTGISLKTIKPSVPFAHLFG